MTPDGVFALVNNYDGSMDAPEYVSGMLEAYGAGMGGKDIKTVKAQGLTSAQIKAAYDAGKAARPENHIDNRTMADVGKTNVNAFRFDHPQLHNYFVEAARILKNDLANSSENRGWQHSNQRGDNGKKIGRYYVQQSSTLLDEAKRQEIYEHAKSELVCDAGDHINQLRYDVDHGTLGGNYIGMAICLTMCFTRCTAPQTS